jgi:hypothetical protein
MKFYPECNGIQYSIRISIIPTGLSVFMSVFRFLHRHFNTALRALICTSQFRCSHWNFDFKIKVSNLSTLSVLLYFELNSLSNKTNYCTA